MNFTYYRDNRDLECLANALILAQMLACVLIALGALPSYFGLREAINQINYSQNSYTLSSSYQIVAIIVTWNIGLTLFILTCLYLVRAINRRRARQQCMVVAICLIALVPAGTILGVGVLLLLRRKSIIALFPRSSDDPE